MRAQQMLKCKHNERTPVIISDNNESLNTHLKHDRNIHLKKENQENKHTQNREKRENDSCHLNQNNIILKIYSAEMYYLYQMEVSYKIK